MIILVNRISSYNSLLRIKWTMLRFKYKTKPLLHLYLKNYGELFGITRTSFQSRVQIAQTNHYIYNFHIIRVGGRLDNADIPENRKQEFLIPKNRNLVNTFVHHLHVSNYHSGPKALVPFIRRNFWLIGARSLARKLFRSCYNYTRYRPKLLKKVIFCFVTKAVHMEAASDLSSETFFAALKRL